MGSSGYLLSSTTQRPGDARQISRTEKLDPTNSGLPRPVHPEPFFGAPSSGVDPSSESGSRSRCANLFRTADDGTVPFVSSLLQACGFRSLYSAIILSAWHSCVRRQWRTRRFSERRGKCSRSFGSVRISSANLCSASFLPYTETYKVLHRGLRPSPRCDDPLPMLLSPFSQTTTSGGQSGDSSLPLWEESAPLLNVGYPA